jgi:ABC-type Na+ efflux pump permease subunit
MQIEEEENTTPTPFLVVLIFWLTVMFASFGLFAPRNTIAVVVLFLGAVSLSGAIFLIEELNNPLGGFIAISRAPMDRALSYIGR